jgi:hypothetical protein
VLRSRASEPAFWGSAGGTDYRRSIRIARMDRITVDAHRLEQLREANDPSFVTGVERFYAPYRELPTRLGRGDAAAVEPGPSF